MPIGIEIESRDSAEATGCNWIETAAYAIRLRGHGTEIIRKSDDRLILLQGDDAAKFESLDVWSVDHKTFDELCAPLFA